MSLNQPSTFFNQVLGHQSSNIYKKETFQNLLQDKTQQNLLNLLCLTITALLPLVAWFRLSSSFSISISFLVSSASLVVYLFRKKWPLAQQIFLLAVIAAFVFIAISKSDIYFEKLNLKQSFLLGNIVGLIEMTFIVILKNTHLRITGYAILLFVKILGMGDKSHSNPIYIVCLSSVTLFVMLFNQYKDSLDKSVFRLAQESEYRLQCFKNSLCRYFPMSMGILNLYFNASKLEKIQENPQKSQKENFKSELIEKFIIQDCLMNLELKGAKSRLSYDLLKKLTEENDQYDECDSPVPTKTWFNLNNFLEEIQALISIYSQQKNIEFHIQKESDVPTNIFSDEHILLEIIMSLISYISRSRSNKTLTLKIFRNFDESGKKIVFTIEENHENFHNKFLEVSFDLIPINLLVKALNFEDSSTNEGVIVEQKREKTILSFMIDAFSPVSKASQGFSDNETNSTVLAQSADHNVQENNGSIEQEIEPEDEGTSGENKEDQQADQFQEFLNWTIKPKNVLIIDSNPHHLNSTARYMEKLGYTPYMAFNGKEGLELIEGSLNKNLRYDLILTDIEISLLAEFEMGQEIAKKLQKNEKSKTPIVGLSAKRVTKEEEERLKENGISCVLEKPLRIDEVSLILEALID